MLSIFYCWRTNLCKSRSVWSPGRGPREFTFFEQLLYPRSALPLPHLVYYLEQAYEIIIMMPIWHVRQQSVIDVKNFSQTYPADKCQTGLQISSFLLKSPTLCSMCCFLVVIVATMYWMPAVWSHYTYISFHLAINLYRWVLISSFRRWRQSKRI